MQSKLLIVDDDPKFRFKLRGLLDAAFPGVLVEEWDSGKHDWPEIRDLNWPQYGLVFFDHVSGAGDGLKWLFVEHQKSGFPPAIVVSEKSDAESAVKAIKAGAENYLPKHSLSSEKLKEAVEEILGNALIRESEGSEKLPLKFEQDDVSLSITKANICNPDGAHLTMRRKPVTKTNLSASPAIRQNMDGWPKIAGYQIQKKIGQGGMSVVYLAKRKSDSETVVIKTLSVSLIDNRKTLLRSNQEFKLISRISNLHIVRLYEHGTIGDAMYTIMEYFPSGDLKQRLKVGITQQQAIQYLLQIASGLAAIHGCGIIHRDLKPGNIMFREDDTLAIIDFGISKDINTKMDLTDPGQVMGTPNYMAPEQGNGGYRPDARSDIYSVGVMLYEMLTGKKPYPAPTGAAIIYKHLHDPIPKLPNKFFEMQGLLDKMMAKYPQDRFQSALDLIEYINKEFRWDITLNFV